MIYKLGILGASGRMGQQITALIADAPQLGGDIFEFCDGITQGSGVASIDGVELRRLGESAREPVHGWIDFSRPEVTLKLLEEIDVPILIGTTGFTASQMLQIEKYAQRHPVMVAPNTSLGIQWLTRAIELAPSLATLGFTAVLDEDHHKHKQDRPSGTAKRILQSLALRGFEQVETHVTRAGAIVGTHSVRFISDGEEITITHRATDRRIFAQGALSAMQFLLRQREPRVYRFEEVLFDAGGVR